MRPQPALTGIERALGDALYQLDLSRGAHELTRTQISALRATGLRASAWLSGHDLTPRTDTEAAEGVARFTALARTAADFLAGSADAAALLGARERLAVLVDRVPAA
ncbi:MAG TPA: hypothetical protein VG247_27595 [Pseudonocardiaceae bacterium]|nr:hypothetical protein [Pseudonocardiaceae bacterium]